MKHSSENHWKRPIIEKGHVDRTIVCLGKNLVRQLLTKHPSQDVETTRSLKKTYREIVSLIILDY